MLLNPTDIIITTDFRAWTAIGHTLPGPGIDVEYICEQVNRDGEKLLDINTGMPIQKMISLTGSNFLTLWHNKDIFIFTDFIKDFEYDWERLKTGQSFSLLAGSTYDALKDQQDNSIAILLKLMVFRLHALKLDITEVIDAEGKSLFKFSKAK